MKNRALNLEYAPNILQVKSLNAYINLNEMYNVKVNYYFSTVQENFHTKILVYSLQNLSDQL